VICEGKQEQVSAGGRSTTVVIRAPGHHPPRPGTIGYNDRDAALALRPNWPRLCIHQAFHTSNRIVRSARPSMARTDGRGFVRRVVDQAILCLSVLLVESAEVLTTHQPTCRLAEHDRTGTARWFPRSLQTGRQVRRPAVPLRYRRRYAALPAPRHSPSSGAVARPGTSGPVRWPKPCGITSTASRRTTVSRTILRYAERQSETLGGTGGSLSALPSRSTRLTSGHQGTWAASVRHTRRQGTRG
jgi:hypothetical protein